MTLPEVLLWNQLKSGQIGFDFNRQFCLGPYIADFYCRKIRLVVEVDGQIHQVRDTADGIRDAWMEANGLYVLRVPAQSVLKKPYSVGQSIRSQILQFPTSDSAKAE